MHQHRYRLIGATISGPVAGGRASAWAVMVGLAFILTGASTHAAEPYRAEAVKAAFLYRFTRYIEWPQSATPRTEFTIAVLGAPLIAAELSQLVAQESVQGLPTRVRSVESGAQAADAQVLYIGREFNGNLRAVIDSLEHRPVLVVSDHPRGLDEGSMLNFVLDNRRVRFEVALSAAQRAGLKLSSDLLSVATRVRGGPIGATPRCSAQAGQLHDFECIERFAGLLR